MAILIERKMPERGDRSVAAAPAGGCCCCCCCCLHTVGSVAGALTARARPIEPDQVPPSAIGGATWEPKHSAAGLYWALVAILTGLLAAYFIGVESRQPRFEEILVILAVFFPGVQLAASLVALIVIASSSRPGRDVRLRHLGRITLRMFIGGVIGTLIMIPLFALC